MNAGGILTTYCAKGAVRRTMKESGFSVERIPGPLGSVKCFALQNCNIFSLQQRVNFGNKSCFRRCSNLLVNHHAIFKEKEL